MIRVHGVRVPVPEALADIRDLIDDAILVREDTTIQGMRLLHRHVGVVAERPARSASPRSSSGQSCFATNSSARSCAVVT